MFKILSTLILSMTLPAQGASRDQGFIFFGDWGQGNAGQRAVASGIGNFCKREACDFVTLLGDNFYPSGVSSTTDSQWKTKFHDIYDSLGLRFYVSLGNHDYGGKPDAQVAYSRLSPSWILPARYYEVTIGEITFFAIDTNAFDQRQQAWLQQRLAVSRSKWKIVFGHHPIYSTGTHGDTSSLVRGLLPVLKGKADMYLSGHDHDKEALKAEGGVHFYVSGAAAETRNIKGGPRTLFKAATLGFAHLKVGPTSARIQFLNQNGAVEWQETLTK